MKIEKKIEYVVTFYVAYHEETEGGMIYDTYKEEVDTIEKAIELLEEANMRYDAYEWKICLTVTKT